MQPTLENLSETWKQAQAKRLKEKHWHGISYFATKALCVVVVILYLAILVAGVLSLLYSYKASVQIADDVRYIRLHGFQSAE